MALTWNFQDSEYSSWSKKKRNKNWSVASSLIWLTMGVDFNMREGEKDIDEFLWRARCYELVTGAFLSTSCRHRKLENCNGHTDEKNRCESQRKRHYSYSHYTGNDCTVCGSEYERHTPASHEVADQNEKANSRGRN